MHVKVSTDVESLSGGSVHMGRSDSQAFHGESFNYVKHKNYELQIMQKADNDNDKGTIPSTYQERLAFFRSYTSMPHNIHYVTMHFSSINWFVWNYVITMVLKSIPSTFLHLFVAMYSPEQPLFLAKMVPLINGHIASVFITSIITLGPAAYMVANYINVLFLQIVARPGSWRNCDNATIQEVGINTTTSKCCVLKQYIAAAEWQYQNSNSKTADHIIDKDGKQCILATQFFQKSLDIHNGQTPFFGNIICLFYVLIWITAVLCNNQIHKRHIWSVFNLSHWFVNFIFFVIFMHMFWISMETTLPEMIVPANVDTSLHQKAFGLDIGFIAESLSCPPLQQILAAKGRQEINPGMDSTAIEISNGVFYLFKGLLMAQMKAYCESTLRSPIDPSGKNVYPYFLLMPVYFSMSAAGEIMIFLFFISHVILEGTVFVIIFQTLIDLWLTEFPNFKFKWYLASLFALIGSVFGIVFDRMDQMTFNFFSICISTLMEVVTIVWLYPLGRLQDDVMFHCGRSLSTARVWTIRIMPFYYIFKVALFIKCYNEYIDELPPQQSNTSPDYAFTWTLFAIPYVCGVLWSLYKVFHYKLDLKWMLRPLPTWGPQDHVLRQMRKQYDSRDYIRSHASRYLSRHLMDKMQATSYKLNIFYSNAKRRSTMPENVHCNIEKKND